MAHLRSGRRAAALAMGAAVVLAACSTDRELTEPDPVPVTEELLVGALLTAADLPEGFTATEGAGPPISTEIVPEHECDDAVAQLEPEEAASAEFTGNGQTVVSNVAWFPGQGGAVDQLFRDVATLCRSVMATDQGVAIRAGALDFGVLSDDSLPIRFEVEPGDGPITERDVILLRQGDLVHVIRLTGPRPSDKVLLDRAARNAIGRLGLLHADTT